MDLRLMRLSLKNFKGCRSFVLEIDGNNCSIFGDNATYKTTVFDSFNWLLFDKDSQNKKDFDIKTLDAAGNVLHGLEHEVEATLKIDGRTLVLRKVYKEKWTQKRGSVNKEFSGHTKDHFVNGVPVSAGDYAGKIASICSEETFKLLASPTYFNTQLHWQKRREILLEVCGDISDSDVIASDPKLKDLRGILGEREIDDHRKVIAAQRKKINDELDKIPVRIDEADRGLPDVNRLDVKELGKQRAVLCLKLEEKQDEITRIKNGGEIAEKTKQLRELESELLDIKNKDRACADEEISKLQRAVLGAQAEVDKLAQMESRTKQEIGDAQERIDAKKSVAGKLRAEWHEVNGREHQHCQDEICPTCKQSLPVEQAEEAQKKALSDFNRRKAQELEEVSAKGKRLKTQIEELEKEKEGLEESLRSLAEDIAIAGTDLSDKKVELAKATGKHEAKALDPTTSLEYKKTSATMDKIKQEIEALQMGTRELLTMAQEEADIIKEQIHAVDYDLQKFRMREQGEARIKELAAEQKKLSAEFEKLEKELYLTEEFIKAKVGLLEGKINSKFKHARFKLFTQNINGGVEPTCETLYNGVPYSSGLNSGHRGIVGLDIIATLSEHYDFCPPIIYDNAESVTRLPKMQGQVICLYVSKKDKQLRIEIEGEHNTLFEEAM